MITDQLVNIRLIKQKNRFKIFLYFIVLFHIKILKYFQLQYTIPADIKISKYAHFLHARCNLFYSCTNSLKMHSSKLVEQKGKTEVHILHTLSKTSCASIYSSPKSTYKIPPELLHYEIKKRAKTYEKKDTYPAKINGEPGMNPFFVTTKARIMEEKKEKCVYSRTFRQVHSIL